MIKKIFILSFIFSCTVVTTSNAAIDAQAYKKEMYELERIMVLFENDPIMTQFIEKAFTDTLELIPMKNDESNTWKENHFAVTEKVFMGKLKPEMEKFFAEKKWLPHLNPERFIIGSIRGKFARLMEDKYPDFTAKPPYPTFEQLNFHMKR
jgi:hypothetical protein